MSHPEVPAAPPRTEAPGPSGLAGLAEAAAPHGLLVAGVAPLLPSDGLPARFRSVALLAPDEPRFWPLFEASPERRDGCPDPLDRWSRRVVGRLACGRGKAVLPFGGPPWRPFYAWALRSGRAWASPVHLLVHAEAGLFVSFRGAVALREEAPAALAARPCDACAAPCLAACPVGAFSAGGFDAAACRAHVSGPQGADCLTKGCRARRACPVGAGRRLPAQSAFHMEAFAP